MSLSLWNATVPMPNFPTLAHNDAVDVVVVGGGIGGVLTAYFLQKAGKKTLLLELGELGSGQTGQTTAHFTEVLDDRYFKLQGLHGVQGAQIAAESQCMALDTIERLVKEERIDCGFEHVDGFLFLGEGDSTKTLQKEWRAAFESGLKGVGLLDRIPGVPFHAPALRFPRQVKLHPLKFLKAIVEAFVRDGGRVHTHTRVVSIKEKNGHSIVTSDQGYSVQADAAVVATNSPINDVISVHTKQAPYRTYAVAFEVPRGQLPPFLMWDTLTPYHYVRTETHPRNSNLELLIVGGEDHKTGQKEHPEAAYTKLVEWAHEKFKLNSSPVFAWSGQVMEPVDGLAFLGLNPHSNHTYIITGDSGNGMTFCTIGALLIRDLILGDRNEWEELYRPSRKNVFALNQYVKENANVAVQYADWTKGDEVPNLDSLPRGEGAIIRRGLKLVAVYRNEHGVLEFNSAACPHLGGAVRWNSAEKTWDCPCHGSRFDCHGKVIEGPAVEDLKQYATRPLVAPELNVLSGLGLTPQPET